MMSVTGGVDTHKDVHAVAALDGIGRVLGTETFPTTQAGQADPTDAIAAARSVLAEDAASGQKVATGPAESVQLMRGVRTSAIKARTACAN